MIKVSFEKFLLRKPENSNVHEIYEFDKINRNEK